MSATVESDQGLVEELSKSFLLAALGVEASEERKEQNRALERLGV